MSLWGVMWIYERKDWLQFTWSPLRIRALLAALQFDRGLLWERGKQWSFRNTRTPTYFGYSFKNEVYFQTLASEICSSAAIEGKQFDPETVCASVAHHLGNATATSIQKIPNEINGMVKMMRLLHKKNAALKAAPISRCIRGCYFNNWTNHKKVIFLWDYKLFFDLFACRPPEFVGVWGVKVFRFEKLINPPPMGDGV